MSNSWGVKPVNNYVSRINTLKREFTEKETANAEKIAKRVAKGNNWTGDIKNLTFKVIPMEICVENFEYEIHYEHKYHSRRETVDNNHYSCWVNTSLTNGSITIEALAEAWRNYDITKAKAKWFNYGTYIKNFDFNDCWDNHYVDDVNVCDKFLDNPMSIIHYQTNDSKFKRWALTEIEFNELCEFYNTPENLKIVASKIKSLRKKIEALRPTVDVACDTYMREMFCDSYGDNNINWNTSYGNSSLWKPVERSERAWYGNQSNWCDGDCERSFMRIIKESIHEFLPNKTELLAAFQAGLHVTVNDEGNHNSKHSDVHSSSFWTYYTNNFSVEIDIYNSDRKFTKMFKDVIVGSSYYSGGW